MSEKLFNEFSSVSAKEWKQKIQVDLKGADYNDTLIWHTNEGITVKPFYHQDDFQEVPNNPNTKVSEFKICQTIVVTNATEANQKAQEAISKGAESIKFIITNENLVVSDLLNNLASTPLIFELQFLSETFVEELLSYSSKTQSRDLIINTDIIGNLAKSGNWFSNLKNDYSKFETIVSKTNQFSVYVALHQNAGANTIQQLAYALAHANEYLNHINNVSSLRVIFNVAVSTNYFFEIAKLRALRLLYASLASEYNVSEDCTIFATPTKRNKTLYDYNTNMLRSTTECMSAILGGSNFVNNLPYDAIYHNSNEFGERISRNQLLILKSESYFNAVDNPSDGSYYIEALTEELAEKALALFKDIEANGGFLQQLKEGTIQRKIKESAAKEQELFNDGKLILLGTNKHANPNDKMKNDLEINPFVAINKRKTLIEPIIEKRLAETLEQERLKTE